MDLVHKYETDHLNCPITRKEIEFVPFKYLPQSLGLDNFNRKVYQMFKENKHQLFKNVFPKTKEERTLSNLFSDIALPQ
jgi:hypothetical protein